MKKTYLLTLGLVWSLFLGCVGNSQPQVYKISNNSLKKEAVVKVDFPKIDPVTHKKINVSAKNIDLSSKMIKYSKYGHFKTYYRTNGTIGYKGINIVKKANYYDFEYKRGDYRNTISGGWYIDIVEFKMPYKIEGNNIILKYPKEYKHTPCQGLVTLCMGVNPLDDFDKLEADVNRIFKKLPNTILTINKTYVLIKRRKKYSL